MKQNIYNILKGKFLIDESAVKNWQFILFCTLLAIIMIACSHQTDHKVHQIDTYQKEVRRLRSQFVDQREHLMKLQMESTLSRKLNKKGFSVSTNPPQEIIVGK